MKAVLAAGAAAVLSEGFFVFFFSAECECQLPCRLCF